MKTLYSTAVTSTGGREGSSKSLDGKIDIILSTPAELGGTGGQGTNPEQLFAAGYSACFIGAIKFVAANQKIEIPKNITVRAEIGIGENPKGVGFAINAILDVNLDGMDASIANKLVDDAHQVCPYSNATRGNIDVTTNVNV
jgi:lipoyl-dependent peroxiredoxin